MIEWFVIAGGAAMVAVWVADRARRKPALKARPERGADLQGLLDSITARAEQLHLDRRRTLRTLAKLEALVAASGPDAETDRLRAYAEGEVGTLRQAADALEIRLIVDRVDALGVCLKRELEAAPGDTTLTARYERVSRAIERSTERVVARQIPKHIPSAARELLEGAAAPDGTWQQLPKPRAGEKSPAMVALEDAHERLETLKVQVAAGHRALLLGEASSALGLGYDPHRPQQDDQLITSLMKLDAALKAQGAVPFAGGASGNAPGEGGPAAPSTGNLTLEALRARDRVAG